MEHSTKARDVKDKRRDEKFDSKLPEESRLQSLVRRVVGEGDLEKRLSAVESLKQYLETGDNAQSVCVHAEEADGATPMFSLYKKWFQREATATQIKQMPNSADPPQNIVIPRPSELYYNKLNPLLKEKGISTHNRKDWPVSILRRVLKELMAETPKDLLSKELWCYSDTAYDWWNVSQSYATIGYVIGLGDRHLDNLLVDLSTGEVVHIDYNICFEKGKSLRIPEKVPFRLTQNLQHALGLTGIEGTFRLSCEHVMKTMRQGKETLLTLLEAFVYDPLVDWTIGNKWCYTGAFYGGNHPLARSVASKQSRRELEREVTVSMFSIKMAENKHEWIANREDLASSISKLESVMAKMCSLVTDISAARHDIEQVEEQTRYLKDALKVGESHAIYSVQRRFLSLCAFESTMDMMKEEVEKQLKELNIIYRSHKETICKLKSKWVSTLTQGLDGCVIVNPLVTFEQLFEFLKKAGQGSLVTQAESVYGDFNSAFLKQLLLMQEMLAVVHKYCSILEQLPFKSLEFNSESYIKKYNILAENLSLESVRAVETEVEVELSEKALKAQEAFELLDNLNKDYAEASKKYDLRVNERFNVSSEDEGTLLTKHEMSLASIRNLLEEPVSGALEAMKSVLIFNLCNIAKQILPQELTIYQTGLDALNIPSLDYFLAACSQANLLIQLSGGVQNDEKMVHVMKTSEAIKMSLESARDLMFNFHTVIIPEAKQSLQDSSKLANFLCSTKLPIEATHLNDIVHQADQIRNMILDGNEFVSRQLQCLFFLHQFQTTLVVQCINHLLEQLLTDASLTDLGVDFLGSEVTNHCLTNQMASTEQMQYLHECIIIACDTLRIYDHSRCLDNYVEIERSLAQIKHQQLVALQWLHSNKFSFPGAQQQDSADGSDITSGNSIRSIMLGELKEAIKNLIVHQTNRLEPLKKPLVQVEKIIGQRLKWAAGANVSIASMQQKFEEMRLSNNDMIERLSLASSELLSVGRILLNFEESSIETLTEMQNNFFTFLKKAYNERKGGDKKELLGGTKKDEGLNGESSSEVTTQLSRPSSMGASSVEDRNFLSDKWKTDKEIWKQKELDEKNKMMISQSSKVSTNSTWSQSSCEPPTMTEEWSSQPQLLLRKFRLPKVLTLIFFLMMALPRVKSVDVNEEPVNESEWSLVWILLLLITSATAVFQKLMDLFRNWGSNPGPDEAKIAWGIMGRLAPIGGGKCSKVWRAKLFGRTVAVRKIGRQYERRAENELYMLNLTEHLENVSKLIFKVKVVGRMLIVTEFHQCSFQHFVESNPTDHQTVVVLLKLLQGLAGLHKADITHTDLTTNNIFVINRNGDLKVQITNLRHCLHGSRDEKFCCCKRTLAAPEAGEGGFESPQQKSDVFAVGWLALQMWTKKMFITSDEVIRNFKDEMVQKIPYAEHLLSHLLCRDPKKRPTAVEASNFPIFWKKNSIPRFFEALHNMLVNSTYKFPGTYDWIKVARNTEIFKIMTENFTYGLTLNGFVRFIRNMYVHRKDEDRPEGWRRTEDVERYVQENFNDLFLHIHDLSYKRFDGQFMSSMFIGSLIK